MRIGSGDDLPAAEGLVAPKAVICSVSTIVMVVEVTVRPKQAPLVDAHGSVDVVPQPATINSANVQACSLKTTPPGTKNHRAISATRGQPRRPRRHLRLRPRRPRSTATT